jgi:hypothetical protein
MKKETESETKRMSGPRASQDLEMELVYMLYSRHTHRLVAMQARKHSSTRMVQPRHSQQARISHNNKQTIVCIRLGTGSKQTRKRPSALSEQLFGLSFRAIRASTMTESSSENSSEELSKNRHHMYIAQATRRSHGISCLYFLATLTC